MAGQRSTTTVRLRGFSLAVFEIAHPHAFPTWQKCLKNMGLSGTSRVALTCAARGITVSFGNLRRIYGHMEVHPVDVNVAILIASGERYGACGD